MLHHCRTRMVRSRLATRERLDGDAACGFPRGRRVKEWIAIAFVSIRLLRGRAGHLNNMCDRRRNVDGALIAMLDMRVCASQLCAIDTRFVN